MVSLCQHLQEEQQHEPGGGEECYTSKRYAVDVSAGPPNYDLSYLVCRHLPTINKTILYKTPNLLKFGFFYHRLRKIYEIYVDWAPSSMMKRPIVIPIINEKTPQTAATRTYTMSI